MATTESGADRRAMPPRTDGPIVAAPRFTRVAGLVIALGVLTQATLAGGFLGSQPGWIDIHRVIGSILPLVGLGLVVAGLIGRRRDPEPAGLLIARIGLLLALIAEVSLGLNAGATRSLLILHIPFSFVIVGLAGFLASRSAASRARPAPVDRAHQAR
jgi:hypothetical protein